MGAMARRMQVLVALAIGCAFGSAATGCAFVWMGTARADDGATVVCVAGTPPSHDFGTTDPTELARVSAVFVPAKPLVPTNPGAITTTASVVSVFFSGSVAYAGGIHCDPGDSVTFVMR